MPSTRTKRRLFFEQLEARHLLASFQGLGDLELGQYFSYATDVSADGSTVVGVSSSNNGREAFRWTANSGIEGIGDILGGGFESAATSVSADGSTVVGLGLTANGYDSFRWNANDGINGLGLYGGSQLILPHGANGVSDDGSVIVGTVTTNSTSPRGYRWTAGNVQWLGDLPGGNVYTTAAGVSADGSTVVGQGVSGSGPEAYRWTEAGGMQGLGDFPGGNFFSGAVAVSSDGATIVGAGTNASYDFEAFRWTSTSGMVGLGDLPGEPFDSTAYGVSADGSVVVGVGKVPLLGNGFSEIGEGSGGGPPTHRSEAFVWKIGTGIRSVRELLVQAGLDMTGWQLSIATGVSANGRVIVGYGVNPSGQSEACGAEFDPPAVVNIATHGWNPLGTAASDWADYADVLNDMPAEGSDLEGRISTYVSSWDSNYGFTTAVIELAASKILTLPGVNRPIEALILKGTAALTAQAFSRPKAIAAAENIAKAVQQHQLYLSEPSISNDSQTIQLIGHSRGAAVNALVSKILADDGYRNVDTYVSLDGFSTDWPADAGFIGDISIVNNVNKTTVRDGGKMLNFQVELGIAGSLVDMAVGWLADRLGVSTISVADIPLVNSLIVLAFGDLRARDRSGFHNEIIAGQGAVDPSTHTNITRLYFDKDNEGFDPSYRLNSYVGEHANDGIGSASASRFSDDGAILAGAGASLDDLAEAFGFVDGGFTELGDLWTEALAADLSPTGDLLIDYLLNSSVDPEALLANVWEVVGNAYLADVDGNFAAQLDADPAGTSISQFIVLPPQAASIDFDLDVLAAGTTDTLEVIFNGAVLDEIDLSVSASTARSVALPAGAGTSGTVKFLLSGPTNSTVSIILDNLTVSVDNQAPGLVAVAPQLPTIGVPVSPSAIRGSALMDLGLAITDADLNTRLGIAIVGANTLHGFVEYSLDDGETWTDVGDVHDANALLLGMEPTNRIRFVPNMVFTGSVADVVTLRAWDRTTGIIGLNGDYFNASDFGGSTPFSAATDGVAVSVVLAGDYDRNGTVNPADHTVWKSAFGATGDDLPADGNGNGVVDAADYVVWRHNLGNALSSGAAGGSRASEQTIENANSSELQLLRMQSSFGANQVVASTRRISGAKIAVDFLSVADTPRQPRDVRVAKLPSIDTTQRDDALIAWLAAGGKASAQDDDSDMEEFLNDSRANEMADATVDAWDAAFESLELAQVVH